MSSAIALTMRSRAQAAREKSIVESQGLEDRSPPCLELRFCLEPSQGLEGNASQASVAELEHTCLEEVRAQLIDAHFRLQNRWFASKTPHMDSFSLASTDAGEDSPTSPGGIKGEYLAPLSVSNTLMPEHDEGITRPLMSGSFLPKRTEGSMRNIQLKHMDGHLWVHWPVDAKRLRCKDRQIISPRFELFPGVFFILMIMPKLVGDKKGQACFQKARGCGSVVLKLVAPVGSTTSPPQFLFCITVGSGERRQTPRGPVEYDFGSSVCGLPKCDELWDFLSTVDAESSTFTVSLDVLPENPGATLSIMPEDL